MLVGSKKEKEDIKRAVFSIIKNETKHNAEYRFEYIIYDEHLKSFRLNYSVYFKTEKLRSATSTYKINNPYYISTLTTSSNEASNDFLTHHTVEEYWGEVSESKVLQFLREEKLNTILNDKK